jgi:hypothetical protein
MHLSLNLPPRHDLERPTPGLQFLLHTCSCLLTPSTMGTLVIASSSSLPSYHSGSEPPSYLIEPSRNEQRVAFAPLSGGRRLRDIVNEGETYVRSNRTGGMSLALKRQASNPRIMPVYGRKGLIDGELTLVDPENISAVKLKVRSCLLSQ